MRQQLIEQAQILYKEIFPCGLEKHLEDCFIEQCGMLQFWFNDKNGSTHMVYNMVIHRT